MQILVLLFSLIALVSVGEAEPKATYAALLPLTGNGADQGQWCKNGLELAADRLNLESDSVELIFEDTRGDPKSAIAAFQSVHTRKKLSGVFTWGSGVAMALSPLTNQTQLIQMGIATATPVYRSLGDFTFRVFPSSSDEAAFIGTLLMSKFATSSIASIYIQNDYGAGCTAAVKDVLRAQNKGFVGEESFVPGENDFRTTLLRLKRLNPDIIYLAAYPNDGALILKQARELGVKAQFLASVAIAGGADFFSLAGAAAEGLLVTASVPNENDDFFKLYRERYGPSPITLQLYAARSYDALIILDNARRACKGGQVCTRDRLFQVREYPGASGDIAFDNAGDSKFKFSLYKVEDRKLVPVEPVPHD